MHTQKRLLLPTRVVFDASKQKRHPVLYEFPRESIIIGGRSRSSTPQFLHARLFSCGCTLISISTCPPLSYESHGSYMPVAVLQERAEVREGDKTCCCNTLNLQADMFAPLKADNRHRQIEVGAGLQERRDARLWHP